MVGWLPFDKGLLIYDRYDIWQVDPSGLKSPINVTNSYGAKYKIRLRCINFDRYFSEAVQYSDTLILTGLDEISKRSNFYKLSLHYQPVLTLLNKGTYTYFSIGVVSIPGINRPFDPVKAKHSGTYLAKRMSATEFPNLCITTDFTSFKPITHLAPQKAYNWMTSELLHWKMLDGKMSDGVLYKPENFDATRKYPVIFHYYEKNAGALNWFIDDELPPGGINIPWYVSNGYLVFVPDIHYKAGYPGESAYNSIVSAAKFLAQKTWVNAKKMGLQGHSFGGYQTNYVVTRTNLFAAAAPGAGPCNFTSMYSDRYNDGSRAGFFEYGQGRIGVSLWQNPALYIENSPIFKADQVRTPLLLMHNIKDDAINFQQGLEWFNGLRRLGKKAWLLQYPDGRHALMKEEDQLDYSIRLSQFFGYYLKDKPAPDWMEEGHN